MPPRPRIYMLPSAIRRELDRQIRANHFGNYDAISQWLASAGHVVGRSAISDYGAKLKRGTVDIPTPRLVASRSQRMWWALPPGVQAALAARLLDGTDGPLQAHAEWLAEQGYHMSVEALEVFLLDLLVVASIPRAQAALAGIQAACAAGGDTLG